VRRRLFNIACGLSALFLGAFIVLWFRGPTRMDVVTLPVGHDTVWMLTSHRGRWVELASFAGWPQPRAGWWSGSDYRDAGPFKFWLAHVTGGRLKIHWRSGQMVLPRLSTGGPIAYDGAYARATQLGYPGPISNNSPDWAMTKGWEVKLPLAYPIALAAVMPAVWAVSGAFRAARRRRLAAKGRCAACGYDLRATSGRCPECGRAMP
jgi:hypothetical protein